MNRLSNLLPEQLIQVHQALFAHTIPHAFGGAIALAFYGIPRGTQDLDINIALPPTEHRRLLDALASLFPMPERARAERELTQFTQAHLLWDETGIDVCMADIPFHDSIAARSHD